MNFSNFSVILHGMQLNLEKFELVDDLLSLQQTGAYVELNFSGKGVCSPEFEVLVAQRQNFGKAQTDSRATHSKTATMASVSHCCCCSLGHKVISDSL